MNSNIAGRSHRGRQPRPFTQITVLDPADVNFRRIPKSPFGGSWHPSTKRFYREIQLIPDVDAWTESDWVDFESTLLPIRERSVRASGDSSVGITSVIALSAELRRSLARFGLGPAERQKQRVSLVSAETAEARVRARRRPKAVADVKTPPHGELVPLSHDEARAHVLGNRTAG